METLTRRRSVYVLADDGQLYRNPYLEGIWYTSSGLCCWRIDWNNTQPRLVINTVGNLPPALELNRCLIKLGISGYVYDQPRLVLPNVYCYDLEVVEISARLCQPPGLVQPRGECLIHSFGKRWG